MVTAWKRGWQLGVLMAALAVLFPSAALSQQRGIDIVSNTDLHFGSIIASPTGGTVTVTPQGTRSTAGVFGFGALGFSAGSFTVEVSTGSPHYQIVLPGSVTLSSGGNTMIVDTFLSDPALSGRVQPPARTEILSVGATLRVGPNQSGGTYSGTYLVTVHLTN